MAKRAEALELSVLGILANSPLHGYELRKRLISVTGLFKTISYGSLYPILKSLVERGFLAEQDDNPTNKYPKRNRIVYVITKAGKDHLNSLLTDSGPAAWDDDNFAVRMSLFAQTSSDTRIHILQGRRSRLETRLADLRANLAKGRERLDAYTLELQQHGLDALEREVRWLNELISHEQSGGLKKTTEANAKKENITAANKEAMQ
jgi:DNA-binding PadR family transcriptional regulator